MRSGIPFAVGMGAFFAWQYGIVVGISSGLVSGVLFGIAMAAFVRFQSKRVQSNKPIFADEELILDGPANHFLNLEGVGGWLYLTDKRMYFKSHAFNLQVHEISIPLNEVSNISIGKSLWLIRNQLHCHFVDERVERFVVNNPDYWLEHIKG